MRTSVLAAIAVLGLSSAAFAQDRTIPAGALDAVQPPIDWRGTDTGPVSLYQGRSVADQPAVVAHPKRTHHRG